MHKDIVRNFTKAQFFGFTGTPRFEINGKVEGKVAQTAENCSASACTLTYQRRHIR